MVSPTRTARLADEFAASYPATLPERLEWLSENLRIYRPRFLRLMGLAADEAEMDLDTPWEVMASRWEDRAWWIEELLCQLIALFDYDWKALANRLHQLAANGESGRVSSPAGHMARLPSLPPVERERTLLTRIAEGGPDVLTWLIEYLTQPAADRLPSGNHE